MIKRCVGQSATLLAKRRRKRPKKKKIHILIAVKKELGLAMLKNDKQRLFKKNKKYRKDNMLNKR